MKKPKKFPRKYEKCESYKQGVRTAYEMLSYFQNEEGMISDEEDVVIAYLLADIIEYCENIEEPFEYMLEKAKNYVEADKAPTQV